MTPPQLDAEFRLCVFDCVDLDSMGARDLVGAVECGASQLRHNPEGLLLEIKSGGFIMVSFTSFCCTLFGYLCLWFVYFVCVGSFNLGGWD